MRLPPHEAWSYSLTISPARSPGMTWPSSSASPAPCAGTAMVGGTVGDVAEPGGGTKVATATGCTIGWVATVACAVWPGADGMSGSG
eukprot:1342649-Alexandrium_andersonii.AAC.1